MSVILRWRLLRQTPLFSSKVDAFFKNAHWSSLS